MATPQLPASNILTDQAPFPFPQLQLYILSNPGSFSIVADEAALALLPGVDGQHAFSLKARTEWIADANDVGPAIPNVKIANPSGGFWVRTQYADAKWRAQVDAPGVPAWTIAAVSGDDEADGTPATPIKTHAEWARRIGNFGQWKLPGNVTVTYPSIAETPGVTDPLPLDDAPFVDTPPGGVPIFLTIQGPPPEPKAGHGGLITAVTARVRATNTPWSITTTGLLDATDIGLRLQITTGPRAGAVTYVDRVLGANNVETSEWEISDLGPATFADTHVTPSNAGADTTQVFLQGKIFIDSARIRGGSQGSLLFKDLDIDALNTGDPVQYFADGAGIMWSKCRHLANDIKFTLLKEGETGFFWGLVFELNCYALRNVFFRAGSYPENLINGGLYHASVIADSAAAAFQWDGDAKCSHNPALGLINTVGATGGGVLVTGAGSTFRGTTPGFDIGALSYWRASTLFYGIAGVYGQGNGGSGFNVLERMHYDAAILAAITVAGPAGVDFTLSGAVLAFRFDDATATFLPAGGLATTYANLAGALGGQAHSPANASKIVPAPGGLFQVFP